ncbi:unannotated protein [freshwater metagenome]|jgi:hypothetical protein|uniref:Unannotated protein n=1 Tax=freshwater metagenome TaxID=449393 RepID=A0A6J6UIU2_9ZZZZ|nr:hypothetical protein [Actinomycetota bacterium]
MFKKTIYSAVAISLLFGTSAKANVFEKATKNPKAGQVCAKKELGKKIKGLECKADGSKFRWILAAKTSTSAATKQMPNIEYKFMPDLLTALKNAGVDCANYKKDPEPGLGSRDGGTCQWGGQELTITLGAGNNAQMKELVDAFKALVTGYVLLKQNWMISLEDGSTAKILSTKLGMEVL